MRNVNRLLSSFQCGSPQGQVTSSRDTTLESGLACRDIRSQKFLWRPMCESCHQILYYYCNCICFSSLAISTLFLSAVSRLEMSSCGSLKKGSTHAKKERVHLVSTGMIMINLIVLLYYTFSLIIYCHSFTSSARNPNPINYITHDFPTSQLHEWNPKMKLSNKTCYRLNYDIIKVLPLNFESQDNLQSSRQSPITQTVRYVSFPYIVMRF